MQLGVSLRTFFHVKQTIGISIGIPMEILIGIELGLSWKFIPTACLVIRHSKRQVLVLMDLAGERSDYLTFSEASVIRSYRRIQCTLENKTTAHVIFSSNFVILKDKL